MAKVLAVILLLLTIGYGSYLFFTGRWTRSEFGWVIIVTIIAGMSYLWGKLEVYNHTVTEEMKRRWAKEEALYELEQKRAQAQRKLEGKEEPEAEKKKTGWNWDVDSYM